EPDSRARYQLLLTLGYLKSSAAQTAREKLLFDNLEDKWFQVAALSAGSKDAPRLFEKAAALGGQKTEGRAMLFRYLTAEISARHKPAEIDAVLKKVATGHEGGWWKAASLEGLNMRRGRGRRQQQEPGQRMEVSDHQREMLLGIFETGEPDVRHAAL